MLFYQEDDPASLGPEATHFQNRISPYVIDPLVPQDNDNVSFDCSDVVPGDVVYVESALEGMASVKTGSYLVRYALSPEGENLTPLKDGGVAGYEGAGGDQLAPIRPVLPITETAQYGTAGWLDLRVPKITAFEEDPTDPIGRLTVEGLIASEDFPTTNGTGWADPGPTSKLYILLDKVQDGVDPDLAVLAVPYTAIFYGVEGEGYFQIELNTITKADGVTIVPQEEVVPLLEGAIGKDITGIKYFAVNITHPTEPDIRLSGHNWSFDPDDPAPDPVADPMNTRHRAIEGLVRVHLRNEKLAFEEDPTNNAAHTWTATQEGFYDPDGIASYKGTLRRASWGAATQAITVGRATSSWVHGEFQEDEFSVAHTDNVPTYISIADLELNKIQTLGVLPLATAVLDCLLPGTKLDVLFWAETGVFLEPNFPRPTFDLGRATRSVICDDDGTVPATEESLDPNEVGERSLIDFALDENGDAVPDYPATSFVERVRFTVRRIRRFHDYILEPLSDAMKGLRFAYEIRRSECVSYTQGHIFGTLVLKTPEGEEDVAGWGTQLGPLDDEDVNVNVGDIVRMVDPNTKDLLCWGEISQVTNGTTVQIGPPGFVGDDPVPGDQLEIYLFRAPVPHEQSNEQLLELATEEVLMTRTAALGPGNAENGFPASGGIVKWDLDAAEGDPPTNSDIYLASVNFLTDTNAGLEDGQINYQAEGILEGDYLLIDPAKELTGWDNTQEQPDPAEEGLRPYGDIGTGDSASDGHEQGHPGELDDNRGYYKVEKVEETRVLVSPWRDGQSEFIGSSTQPPVDRLHGGGSTPLNFFALYPTIHASALSGEIDPIDGTATGREGQGDLRPTAFAGEDPQQGIWANGGNAWDEPGSATGAPPHNSFKETPFSIGPFSYRFIRPTKFLRDDTVELIFFHRERILSLMENFEMAMKGTKRGSYWDFQNDRHSFDLGDPTIPDTGLGVPRNDFLYGLAGQYQYAPFLNDSDCLSALDRRVILEDILLDIEHPPNDPPDPFYTKFSEEDGFPLLLGRIDQVLDKTDRIRQKRLAWLFLRTTKTDGTLANIRNWRAQLVERLIERERMRRLQESMGG